MLTKPLTLVLLLALAAHPTAADTDRRFINGGSSAAQNPPPFSNVVLVGNTLYGRAAARRPPAAVDVSRVSSRPPWSHFAIGGKQIPDFPI